MFAPMSIPLGGFVNHSITYFFQSHLQILLFALASLLLLTSCNQSSGNIKIAIIHSQSGTMSESELPVIDAMQMAIDEINQNGGVLGKKVEAIIADGASNPSVFAEEAERLINKQGVKAIFACWTSHCRTAIKPIIEKYNNLLFYSVQFEGLETSNNIIYSGSAPNQQIIPGISWIMDKIQNDIYLIGSDYIFPRIASRIIHNMVYMKGGSISSERYIPLGETDMKMIIVDIKKKMPNFIVNTINGDSNKAFFNALTAHGLDHIPVMSFSIGEQEVESYNADKIKEHYITTNYFQSLGNSANKDFTRRFQNRYGRHRKIGNAMASSFSAIKLWAQAVTSAKTAEPELVHNFLANQSINSPEGVVTVDIDTGYLWKSVFIGRIQENGSVKSIWKSGRPIKPQPYPISQDKNAWIKFKQSIARPLPK